MDIKLKNKDNEIIVVPLSNLSITEDNGTIIIKNTFQLIGYYEILPPVKSLQAILDRINEGFVKLENTVDLSGLLKPKQ